MCSWNGGRNGKGVVVRVDWGAGGRGYLASRLKGRGGVGWGASYDLGCSNTWPCCVVARVMM